MDCMDGMKEFPDKYFELAVCDPPYFHEANLHYFYGAMMLKYGVKRNHYHKSNSWNVPGNDYYQELLRVSKEQIIFGINYFNFTGVPPGRIIWDKQRCGLINSFSDAEIASCSLISWALDYGKSWEDIAILEVETKISDIVLPVNSDGKVRTSKIKVLREVPLEECGVLGKILAKRIRNK